MSLIKSLISCLFLLIQGGLAKECTSGIGGPHLRMDSLEKYQTLPGNDGTYIFNNVTGKEVSILCSANYPIDFTFEGHLTNSLASATITRRRISEQESCYQIKVKTIAFEESTGNYSCFSVEKPQTLRRSIYLYISRLKQSSYLINRNGDYQVAPNIDEEEFIFPCAISKPSAVPGLFDEDDQNLYNGNNFKYDAKRGFILNWRVLIGNQERLSKSVNFTCRMLGSNKVLKDEVRIQLVQPKEKATEISDFEIEPKGELFYISQGESFKVSCKSKHGIRMKVLGSLKGDSMVEEINEGDFRFAGVFQTMPFQSEFIYRSIENIFQIYCIQNENAEQNVPHLILHTWTIVTGGYLEHECKNKAIIECSNWVECQLRKCPRFDHSCTSSHPNALILDGVTHCLTKNLEFPKGYLPLNNAPDMITTTHFSDLDNQKYTNPTQFNHGTMLRIEFKDNQTRENLLRGNASNFDGVYCEASTFLFAGPLLWNLELENNDIINVDEKYVKNIRGERESIIRSQITPLFSLPIRSKVIKMYCIGLIWNSTSYRMTWTKFEHLEDLNGESRDRCTNFNPRPDSGSFSGHREGKSDFDEKPDKKIDNLSASTPDKKLDKPPTTSTPIKSKSKSSAILLIENPLFLWITFILAHVFN